MSTKTKKDLEEENEQLKQQIEELTRYQLVYKNLRYYFNLVVDSVLGKDYYNMGMDTYTCDKLTCEDLIRQKRIVVLKDKTNIKREQIISLIIELYMNQADGESVISIDDIKDKLYNILGGRYE